MSGAPSQVGRSERLLQEPTAVAAEILCLVESPLEEVERLFRENLASPVRIVDEIGGYVGEGRGKRVRPTLHLLCCGMCDYDGPNGALLATVLEFIHAATLVHDDVLDDATTRRGRPSVNRRWGNHVSVLFGDYLYAKAMEIALGAGSLEVMQTLADVTLRMTEGEMLQTRYVGRLDLAEEEYSDLIERKTAVLFGGCCELAGILANVGEDKRARLRRFGVQLGMAFQLVDDLLDFTGDPRTLGKPAGSDLREGKVTLALIDLLASGSSRARALAEQVIGDRDPESPAIVELTALLRESGALRRTQARANRYAQAAVRDLAVFPDSPFRRALGAMPELLVLRDR